MHYHILLTEDCNSQCKYCYKKSLDEYGEKLNQKFKFDFSAPLKSEIDIKKLKSFLNKDKNPVLIFYGGEPLLELEKIKDIMDNIDVPFRMQTNGLLLDKLDINYLNKIEKILVSVDGDKKRTDENRGKGTFDKLMNNLTLIKSKGYNGEIIARMTISNNSDIYEQVINLINFGFTSIHWQIDAGFYESDFNEKEFSKFIKDYNKSNSRLIKFWIDEMKKGNVLKLYPFLGIIYSLLEDEKTKLRCGAGHSGYAITTNGNIIACPIMNCMSDFVAGNLNSNPKDLKKFGVVGECVQCNYLDLCGGRCLYWNYSGLWPKKGNDLICENVKHLINELKKSLPKIKELIKTNVINNNDFLYEKYFGPEIIP